VRWQADCPLPRDRLVAGVGARALVGAANAPQLTYAYGAFRQSVLRHGDKALDASRDVA
jgi:hypothetical protein